MHPWYNNNNHNNNMRNESRHLGNISPNLVNLSPNLGNLSPSTNLVNLSPNLGNLSPSTNLRNLSRSAHLRNLSRSAYHLMEMHSTIAKSNNSLKIQIQIHFILKTCVPKDEEWSHMPKIHGQNKAHIPNLSKLFGKPLNPLPGRETTSQLHYYEK